MSCEYVSIKEDVLKKLEANLPEIRERFGIDTIGIFGSVARGEDSLTSDVDILYKFKKGSTAGIFVCMELVDYLESLFGRSVDFVSINSLKPYFRVYVEPDMILFGSAEALA